MAQVCVLGGRLVGRFVAINLDSRGHAVRTPLLSIEGMKVADLVFTAEDPRRKNQYTM
jgi:hypothetical protein